MDLEKLDLLLKKTEQAISQIHKLKVQDEKNQQIIKNLADDNRVLKQENESLHLEVDKLKSQLLDNNRLQSQIELKISEMIKNLPDIDTETSPIVEEKNIPVVQTTEESQTSSQAETEIPSQSQHLEKTIESEEEMLKQFVHDEINEKNKIQDEQKSSDNNSNFLFNFVETNESIQINEKETLAKEEPVQENLLFEDSIKNKFDIKFEEALIDTHKDEIEFNFSGFEESSSDTEELPRGVL